MNVTDPIAASTEISGNFGLIITMIAAGLFLILIVYVITQLKQS